MNFWVSGMSKKEKAYEKDFIYYVSDTGAAG